MAGAEVINASSLCLNKNVSDQCYSCYDSEINGEEFTSIITSVQNLFVKYRMCNDSSDKVVTSGGLQQYIARKLKQRAQRTTGNGSEGSRSWTDKLKAIYSSDPPSAFLVDDEDGSIFHCLPVNLKLQILSYLDAQSLCQACCVCRDWCELTCDPILWRRLLQRDVRLWAQISHLSNPQVYQDVASDWSQKEIYLKCSPDFQRQLKAATSTFQQVSSMLRAFIPRKIPRVAMFGPGLESSTSSLVRRVLYEDSDTFHRVAMFPGQFEGVGGGITLRLPAGHSLRLSVLYSATKQERERRQGRGRLEGNKLLQRREGEDDGSQAEPVSQYELLPQIRHLCQTLDAFIFVVDASQTEDVVTSSKIELQAMLRDPASSPRPVLVLSCIARPGDVRLPACDIVRCLDLSTLVQPWLVIDCVCETLESIDAGFIWLVEQAQMR